MESHEQAAIDEARADFSRQWSVTGGIDQPFSCNLARVVCGDARRTSSLASALNQENSHVLCLTIPSEWYDVAAERLCDVMHMKSVYGGRASMYSEGGGGSGNSDQAEDFAGQTVNFPHVYTIQLFFQLVAVLWRWRDRNDRLPWTTGGVAAQSSSEDENSGDDETEGEPKKKKKKKKKKKVRLGGAVRDECTMAVDWRWRDVCGDCAAMRKKRPWAIILCDHSENVTEVTPVSDYTFWFIVKGWSHDVWTKRVGYAMIAVIKRMHLNANCEEETPPDTAQCSTGGDGQSRPLPARVWNDRKQDSSDAWKNVNTPHAFQKAAMVYLQHLGMDVDLADAAFGTRHNGVKIGFQDLIDKFNPSKLFSLDTFTARMRSHGPNLHRIPTKHALLAASTLEISYSDVGTWNTFWRKYLPHYDLLCVRPFRNMVPGVYHLNVRDLELEVAKDEAARAIPYLGSTHSVTAARVPVKSNADTTAIWRLAHESTRLARDAQNTLVYKFITNKGHLFTDEERKAIPWVWRYITRKRAFIKYMIRCRSPEAHVSHALVAMWGNFFETNGSVYKPEAIRPIRNGEPEGSPWDYYFHNLTPFGNFKVNSGYHLWSHYNVDPTQVQTGILVIDSGINSTRGEHDAVGLNPLIHSSDPSAGKSFITKQLLKATRVSGTVTEMSHKSEAARHIQRMGTHDDMVVDMDEIKRNMFCNRDEGGMADPKQKELMSSGYIKSHVMQPTGLPGQDSRGEQTFVYNELCTFVGTCNMQIMDLDDKAFLTRWLLSAHNKCNSATNRRPRESPIPPAHVVKQLHQIQFAVTEIHKLTQTGSMDVEDTFAYEIALDAFYDALEMTPDTQRKDQQIKSLARIHAICDLIVTHFWVPGGLYYNQTITPSRLLSLNDFLMVRTEHIVFAIGQMCNTGTDATQFAIMHAIAGLWRSPNHMFTVRWGKPVGEMSDWDTGGPHGQYVASVSGACLDIVVFEGVSKRFIHHFCRAIHHWLATNAKHVPAIAHKSTPTCDQIESHLRRWMMTMHIPMRATAANALYDTVKCSPDAIVFTDEALPPEQACGFTEGRNSVWLQFPSHMLLTAKVSTNAIAGTRFNEIVEFSMRRDQQRATALSNKGIPKKVWNFSYLYGGMIPGSPEFYSTIPPPSASVPTPTIPYRYYERVMTVREYQVLTGADPPIARDEHVPMVISLDEFAERSRLRTTQMTRVHIDDAMFARVLSKLIFSDYARSFGRSEDDVKQMTRAAMMAWGFLYRRSGSHIYKDLQKAASTATSSASAPRTYNTNLLCDYSDQRFCAKVVTQEDALGVISRGFIDTRRASACKAGLPGAFSVNNHLDGTYSCTKQTTYPAKLPQIVTGFTPVHTRTREESDAPDGTPKRRRTADDEGCEDDLEIEDVDMFGD